MQVERADQVWLLGAYSSECEARFWEQYYSVSYGIPNWCFVAFSGYQSEQEGIDKLFMSLDSKSGAKRLFAHLSLDEEYPHCSRINANNSRRAVFCVTQGRDGRRGGLHQYRLSVSDEGDAEKLVAKGLPLKKQGRCRGYVMEGMNTHLQPIRETFARVQSEIAVDVAEYAKWAGESLPLIPAGHILRGMRVFVEQDGAVVADSVESVEGESYTGMVYDFDIDRYHNFVANGVCVRNSIYAFRGARYQNIVDFINENPDLTQIPLEKNYRSTPQIVKVADRLIRHNKSHIPIDFQTDNPPGNDVICVGHFDPQQEAEWIANNIQEAKDSGWHYKDIAVFYRINRLSMAIETALSSRGIPYKVIGGPSFYNRSEIKDSVAMLKFLINPKDGIAFERLATIIGGMGDVTVGIIESYAKEHNIDILEACRRADQYIKRKVSVDACKKIVSIYVSNDFAEKHPGDALALLISRFDYYTYLHKNPKTNEKAEDREDNVKELIDGATRFGEKNANVKKYLDNIALVTSNDKDAGEAVTLTTFHGSKGCEWAITIIAGMEEGICPHQMAINDAGHDAKKINEAIEEERRATYVAFSRAMKVMMVSYCKSRSQRGSQGKIYRKFVQPSRFLKEAGLLKSL
jgi:hypothetical protein